MAHIESGGSGRKTTLDVNLVPFIDLMSVLITFLLISAVWTQVSMIQIGSSVHGKQTESQPMEIPPDVDIPIKLDIRKNGYQLTIAKRTIQIPLVENQYDITTLIGKLSEAKQEYPEKLDGAIAMADELPYENLIKGMDAFLKSGFTKISVLTGGPN